MIPAKKSAVIDAMLYRYFRRFFAKAFHTVAVKGMERFRDLPKDRPVIVICNHTNWWDALMVFMLTRAMPHKKVFCMMEEKQLKDYRFFARLGAFSVDLTSRAKAAASVRYALRLLEQPETAMWIFPQGKICPPSEQIEPKPGTDFMAKRVPHAIVLPLALRYEFFREDRPNILLVAGATFPASECSLERIGTSLRETFAVADEAAKRQDLTGFTVMFHPQLTINKRWQWVKMAMTGRLKDFEQGN